MKVKEAIFSEKQPDYRYMPIGNGMADVFIYKFIKEVVSEEDETVQYVHDMNEFRVSIDEITEEMVKNEPLKYLDYSTEDIQISLEERINALEGAIVDIAQEVYNG